MLLRKRTAGSDSFGNEWKTDKSVVEVPDWQGEELLRIKDAGFTRVENDEDEDAPDPAAHERETPEQVRFPHEGGRAEAPANAFAAAGTGGALPDDQEHPPLYPATQSLAPAHAYGDDRLRHDDEQQHHEQFDALADKRDEELAREAEIKGDAEHDEAIKRAALDAQAGNPNAPQPPTNADVLGDESNQAAVLEPGPATGVTAADATGKKPRRPARAV